MMRPRNNRRFFIFPLVAVLVLGIGAAAVMLLWNAVLPDVLSVKRISYRQSLGLLLLCRILFGRFGRPGGGQGRGGNPWRQKWQGMNEEERARFKEEWRKRCGNRGQS